MDQEPNKPANEQSAASTPPAAPAPIPVPTPSVAPQSAVKAAPGKADPNGPNQLAALMLTSTFGPFGLHQLYLGNKTQGWVRFALAVLSVPLVFVFIGLPILFVLMIWAAVDFVRIGFGMATDSAGNKLAGSERDSVWSKVIAIVSIVLWTIYVLIYVMIFAFGLMNFMNTGGSSSSSADPLWPESRSY